jgi:hypothetical protein
MCDSAAVAANHHMLLTTPGHGYGGDVIRRDDSMLLTVFGIAV